MDGVTFFRLDRLDSVLDTLDELELDELEVELDRVLVVRLLALVLVLVLVLELVVSVVVVLELLELVELVVDVVLVEVGVAGGVDDVGGGVSTRLVVGLWVEGGAADSVGLGARLCTT